MMQLVKKRVKPLAKYVQACIRKDSELAVALNSELFSFEHSLGSPATGHKWVDYWRASRFLYTQSNYTVSPGPGFDARWYRSTYPDVANSDIHPFIHYIKSGRLEGRLPAPNPVLPLDDMLWSGPPDVAQAKLAYYLSQNRLSAQDTLLAHWALCRRMLYVGQAIKAFRHAKALIAEFTHWEPAYYRRYFLLCIDVAIQVGEPDQADEWYKLYQNTLPHDAELHLVNINLLSAKKRLSSTDWCNNFNALLESRSLLPVSLTSEHCHISHLTVATTKTSFQAKGRVSVIVPMYNAGQTITYVLQCLDNQTWPDLEVIISDDYSTDRSVEIVEQWIANTPKRSGRIWKLLTADENIGAYAVRNRAMACATGDFLTVNDADDWAHPQKLALQVQAICENNVVASVSSMVRTLPDLRFYCWRLEDRWIFRNVSSLMIKKEVLTTLGFWDEIKAGADTEYYYRLLQCYGDTSVTEVMPDVPLSLQLVRQNSLTQSSATHASTQFKGPRKWYLDAAYQWHKACSSAAALYLTNELKERPFYCPDILLSRKQHQPPLTEQQQLINSSCWDAQWYIQRYADLHNGSLDPVEHFLKKGMQEGRDPGPEVSFSGLRFKMGENVSLQQVLNTDIPYHPVIRGTQTKASALSVLLVGHQGGVQLYGAERSLADIAAMLSLQGVNVYILLPEASNTNYINQLCKHCVEVKIIPYGWWFKAKQANQITVKAVADYIKQCAIDIVHANTLVLDEPLIAARQLSVPLIVHVREDLPSDPALQQVLLATPEEAHDRLNQPDIQVLCNSQYMLNSFRSKLSDAPQHSTFIYNALNTDMLGEVNSVKHSVLNVGLISSNIAKKGLNDFFELAQKLKHDKRIVFKLFGPRTSELEQCLNQYSLNNIDYCGYAQDVITALNQLDVVLSLSKFNESFGRTVAEGQLSGKVVIAYNKGAPAELIKDQATGYLVGEQDYTRMAEILLHLCDNELAISSISEQARATAVERFSYHNCAEQLLALYHSLLPSHSQN